MIDCVASGSLGARIAMGMRVARALRYERRIGHAAAACSRLMRIAKHYAVRSRNRRNLSLLSGGAWIALVGPKGTGKSTLAGLLAKKLGKNLDVTTIHLGKPPADVAVLFAQAIVAGAAQAPAQRSPARI